jgi:hypothetical protein
MGTENPLFFTFSGIHPEFLQNHPLSISWGNSPEIYDAENDSEKGGTNFGQLRIPPNLEGGMKSAVPGGIFGKV